MLNVMYNLVKYCILYIVVSVCLINILSCMAQYYFALWNICLQFIKYLRWKLQIFSNAPLLASCTHTH